MVKISSFVFTVALCAAYAFGAAIPHLSVVPHHAHQHTEADTTTTGGSQIQSYQTFAAREPGWFSLGAKVVKGGVKAAKSKKGRRVIKKVGKGAFAVLENF
ncbi:hypothetical protein BDN70DRAFT_998903 [Pholiota conissans]|uniref:Uncharacterized protein n=1 Tax=Pholiota conissans TaxID=109636 RepID=A0A9P5YL09_9AGAR|nr:hypothetical protein BDN70DRAFT_998903 [Pholiota conissans]